MMAVKIKPRNKNFNSLRRNHHVWYSLLSESEKHHHHVADTKKQRASVCFHFFLKDKTAQTEETDLKV